ncbi:Glutamate receptor ionotropic, kainate 3 [Amphibalanus amphitrite]|uniref:Glutamate receptor ionotropic, kainate 3 n=1 Tax=Amphibalanus amphitrite TaxID=1232801 RepID=A0A6A4VR95_AMPAM|nr:Glutamate receptor ionotropic, kainate 3 [Amphibalanus amphitrite]
MLAAGLNFTPKIVCPKDGKFGYQLPNGTWNGIVGLLQHRRAELMLVSLVMLEQRRRVVDYLGPVEWTYYGFVIRDRTLRLGDSEVNWRAYTEPFSPALWTAAFALLLCAAGVWSAMAAAAPQAQTSASEPGATTTPAEPFWTVLGVLVQQGASVVPESSSQRILLGSLWVFSVVLFASFTSNIVSLLASTRYVMPFETLEQLAALTDWKIIANPESADLHQLFRIHELNRTGKLEPIKAFLPHALDILLTNDKTVLFTAFSNVDHVLRRNCSFVWSAIRVLPSAGYLTAQRNLPYRDAIATRLSHLSEAGLLKHLWEKTLLQPTAAGCRRLSQFSTMTLRQTAPALTLLAVGMLTAALVAFAECRWARRRARRQRRGQRTKRSRKQPS